MDQSFGDAALVRCHLRRSNETFVLYNLAVGLSVQEILQSYPSLSEEAVQAAIAYAAELARERVVALN